MTDQTSDSPLEDDLKARFRQALEAKQPHAGVAVRGKGKGKVAGPHGSETSGTEQMFRRKSGA